jgi:ubiquinone/menaquinone biosynthesis C-methylase UbiE
MEKSQNLQGYSKKGFDDRIVRYEQIHKIKDEYYQALLSAIDPHEGEVILEGCSGYADVSRHIIEATKDFQNKPEIYLVDESAVQMARARSELKLPEDHMILGDIRQTGMPIEKFDKAVIKMGVHELPKQEQPKVFSEIYRLLKPEGKFIIWELSLNKETQQAFQDILRKKDELAGFEIMIKNRYFQRHDELQKLFEDAGFKDIKDEYKIRYTFDPKGRFEELVSRDRREMLEEKGTLSEEDEKELHHRAQERVDTLIAYIRERVTDDMKDKVEYKDLGDNIEMTFDKIIMSGKK